MDYIPEPDIVDDDWRWWARWIKGVVSIIEFAA